MVRARPSPFPIVVSLLMFAMFGSPMHASEESEEAAMLRAMVERREWRQIHAFSDKLEEDWLRAPTVRYFKRVAVLCRAVGKATDLKPEEYVYVQELAGRIMTKSFMSGIGSETEDAWYSRYEVVKLLIEEPSVLDNQALSAELFATLRSRTAANVALFCEEVNSAYKPNRTPKMAFINVSPPINIDQEPIVAGMSPEALKNPVSRKAYEEAIKENSRIIQENSIQRFLKMIADDFFSLIQRRLENLYSREPKSREELDTYLAMASFDKGVAARAVVAPPVRQKDEGK